MKTNRTATTSHLVLHLAPTASAQYRWVYLENRRVILQGESREKGGVAAGAEGILLLPADDLILQWVTLPGGNTDALKWQLEPRILSDVDTLHCAVLNQKGDDYLLAAIDKQRLQHHIDTARAWGIEPQRALPDVWTLPDGQAIQLDDRWLTRPTGSAGFAFPTEAHSLLIPVYPELAAVTRLASDDLTPLARGALDAPGNLLQQDFAPRTRRGPAARIAALAGIGLLLSLLLEPLLQGAYAHYQHGRLEAQVLTRYQHFFPHARPSDPLAQMRRQALQTAAPTAQAGVLDYLRQSASLLATLNNNPLKRLDWAAEQQRLSLDFSQPVANLRSLPAPEGLTLTIHHQTEVIIGSAP
ncbi:type II secretion system protein GspL [Pantoea sp. 1.19]|uniref:type II secretion system protein GspL n=1 Tax=Pantoea sp. 1.19 TaxID=1925589 RepID=UPI000948EADD|nr:type II secretion system protein GspL [Pantoea sp. 1.19]